MHQVNVANHKLFCIQTNEMNKCETIRNANINYSLSSPYFMLWEFYCVYDEWEENPSSFHTKLDKKKCFTTTKNHIQIDLMMNIWFCLFFSRNFLWIFFWFVSFLVFVAYAFGENHFNSKYGYFIKIHTRLFQTFHFPFFFCHGGRNSFVFAIAFVWPSSFPPALNMKYQECERKRLIKSKKTKHNIPHCLELSDTLNVVARFKQVAKCSWHAYQNGMEIRQNYRKKKNKTDNFRNCSCNG